MSGQWALQGGRKCGIQIRAWAGQRPTENRPRCCKTAGRASEWLNGSIEGTPTTCSPRFISGRWAVKDRGEKGDSQMQDFYSRLQPAGGGEESCQRLLRMWWW